MPVTSSSSRAARSRPQSIVASTSPGKRSSPVRRTSTPSPPAHLLGADRERLAGEQPRGADAVAADVHQRAALERRLQAHVAGTLEQEGERCPDQAQLADLLEQLDEPARLRVVAPHERLGEHEAAALGGVERARDVVGVTRQRLLAEHVPAGLQRAQRPLDVERVRQRDVDRLDVRIGEQRLVGAVRTWNAERPRLSLGARAVARADRDDLDAATPGAPPRRAAR